MRSLPTLRRGFLLCRTGWGVFKGGGLASKIVVSVLPKMLQARLGGRASQSADKIRLCLQGEILSLSKHLRSESAGQPALTGMGATLVMALLRGRHAHVAHMGDSRCYLFRKGRLTQLTKDHSVVGILLQAGEITTEEAKTHPARGKITRFIGMEAEVYPDIRSVPLKKGDRLLLCSDGVTGMVPDAEIAALLSQNPEPKAACQALVAAANLAGGKDNITAVIVEK